jgi:hypothetical protein
VCYGVILKWQGMGNVSEESGVLLHHLVANNHDQPKSKSTLLRRLTVMTLEVCWSTYGRSKMKTTFCPRILAPGIPTMWSFREGGAMHGVSISGMPDSASRG